MKKDIQELEMEAVASKKNVSKGIVALAVLASASASFAATTFGDATTDSFGQLLEKFVTWMQGNLGKLLALIGFIGTFIIYLMTHKGSVLFVGIIISLIAGGLVGIVSTFFNAGATAFTAIP
jgi:type IV secretory pathway VirB2 component (pilin)